MQLFNKNYNNDNSKAVPIAPGKLRDDRVLPETRVLSAFIVPFLLVAFVMLYFFPDNTDTLFAWTIKPSMTPLIMGAGYISGSYFFTRAIFARRWHTIHLGFLPITAFTIFLAIASFLHLDRFHQGHISFYAWMGLYIITPVLVPLVWWRNSRTDPGRLEPGDLYLPPVIRYLLGLAGLVQFLIALVLLISPDFMISVWPWKLTPLTAQVIGGWFALPSVVAMLMALDGRWSAIRITLHSQIIGLGLMLVGIIRAWGDFDKNNPMTWAFAGGIGLMFVALGVLDFYMEGLKHRAPAGLTNSTPPVYR
jgi:hypothetical protein